jgi:hypothetical protein
MPGFGAHCLNPPCRWPDDNAVLMWDGMDDPE